MRSLRFRLWLLLVIVSGSGIAIGAYTLSRRASKFRNLSRLHSQLETATRQVAESFDGMAQSIREANLRMKRFHAEQGLTELDSPEQDSEAEKHSAYAVESRSRADYYRRMKQKYDYAARHPWLSVPPDQPRTK